MAKRDEVIAALRARSARGAALNYAAVVADDEALTGRARRIFGDWNAGKLGLSGWGWVGDRLVRLPEEVIQE